MTRRIAFLGLTLAALLSLTEGGSLSAAAAESQAGRAQLAGIAAKSSQGTGQAEVVIADDAALPGHVRNKGDEEASSVDRKLLPRAEISASPPAPWPAPPPLGPEQGAPAARPAASGEGEASKEVLYSASAPASDDLPIILTKSSIQVPERPEVDAVLREFNSIGRSTIAMSLERAGRFLPLVKKELELMCLPLELAALPLIESNYQNKVVSSAGATGLWQFVPSTAREYKLRMDWWIDERLDPVASTRAAVKLLKDLFDRYGDWSLALAAYNSGAGSIDRAIVKSKDGDDFWDLCSTDRVRAQTRRYVPKFYAALSIMADPEAHGFEPLKEAESLDFDWVRVEGQVSLALLSRRTGIAQKELQALNPALKRGVTPPGPAPYDLKVPKGYGALAELELSRLSSADRLEFKTHKIAQGDSIARIAQKYSADPDEIVSLNRLSDPKKLKTGIELVIPVPKKGRGAGQAQAAAKNGKPGEVPAFHSVSEGETLWAISRRYGIAVQDLIRWNGLDDKGTIQPGMKLLTTGDRAGTIADTPEEPVYVVKAGDNIYSISRAVGVNVRTLMDINGLHEKSLIHPGDRLKTAEPK